MTTEVDTLGLHISSQVIRPAFNELQCGKGDMLISDILIRLLRGGRLITMAGTERMETMFDVFGTITLILLQPFTTSLFSTIKVPSTSCDVDMLQFAAI
jgi:hypothetical protein